MTSLNAELAKRVVELTCLFWEDSKPKKYLVVGVSVIILQNQDTSIKKECYKLKKSYLN